MVGEARLPRRLTALRRWARGWAVSRGSSALRQVVVAASPADAFELAAVAVERALHTQLAGRAEAGQPAAFLQLQAHVVAP